MRTITFYSYKGGVGRSLALANMAKRLSEFNKKVCLLDFDLEAPGLSHKFSPHINPQQIKKGIVDYIYDYYVNGLLPESIKEFSTNFKIYGNKESVDFIAAGNTNSNDYWRKLSAINWYDLLYDNKNGLAFFLDLKEKIKTELNPDFLLIDSRTGITEISGITMSILADEIVVLAANNKENFEGAQKIIKSVTDKENSILGKTPKITFVLSRIPFTEKPEDRAKEINLIRRVRTLIDPAIVEEINIIHSDRELEENEELKIGYDKENSSPQISRDYLNLFEKITKNEFSPEEVQKFNDLKLSENLFIKATFEKHFIKQIEYLGKAIKLSPDNIEFHAYRMRVNYENRIYENALQDCENILRINSEYFDAYMIFGNIYFLKEEYEKALNAFETAISINPKNRLIYCNTGLIYDKLGDLDTALKYFSKAIEIDASYALAYNNRANVYRLIGDSDMALTDIYKAIELDSALSIAYLTLAEINAQLNKINEFYLNLDVGLKLAFENKTTKNNNDDIESAEYSLKNEDVYKPFYGKERFQKILEKYNIILLDVKGEK